MSTPCEEIRPDLEALLGQLTEGGLDADGRRRLAAILHDHPEARQIYLDHCQMHALLRAAHGELSAFARPRRRWRIWAAAAVVGAAALLPFLLSSWSYVGQHEGQAVRRGQILRQGDVRYPDGTTVTLEDAEAVFYADRLRLDEGVVRCAVKPRSTPFAIATPHAEATVLGTAFELDAAAAGTRLKVTTGRVRLSAGARSVQAGPGDLATADRGGLALWSPVCDLRFAEMKTLPARMESVFSASQTLHTPGRTIVAEPLGRFVPGGFHLGTPGHAHGLHVWRWTEAVGDDLLIEADVAGGDSWSLGLSVSGDSFEGYRIIFAGLDRYPHGVAVDTIHPVDCVLLAQDPRPIDYARDHTLRVERRGRRMRVWIDRELRIDTEIAHPLPEGRRRTFAFSNYGAPPLLRALRVWKAVENP